jgi:hypothetical protein
MNNSENLMLVDVLKDLIRDDSLNARDLDEFERDISSYASKLWDQICVELKPAKKSELTAELNQVNKNLQAVYAARETLYSR